MNPNQAGSGSETVGNGQQLVERFLEALPESPGHRLAKAPDNLSAELARIVNQSRVAHPDVQVSAEAFVAYLAERIAEADLDDWPARLQEMAVEDLYLACGCAQGERTACENLTHRCSRVVKAPLRRLRLSDEKIEEVRQSLLTGLLVARPGESPRIVNYAGWGDLDNWLRVAAVRTAHKLLRKTEREIPSNEAALADVQEISDDLELEYLLSHYQPDFKAAFAEAVAALSRRERNMLRFSVIDRLSIDKIGAIYHIHRATAARQLARAKENLAGLTRQKLSERLKASPAEVRSLMKLVDSQLELSIQRYLKGE